MIKLRRKNPEKPKESFWSRFWIILFVMIWGIVYIIISVVLHYHIFNNIP